MAAADTGVSAYYLALFAGRTDAYSVWHGTPTDGSWSAVREELTTDLIHAGLTRAGSPVSGYMTTTDSTCHVMAIDFDTEVGLAQADLVAGTMTTAGAPAYVEASRRGAHLWATLSDPVPAKVARRALRQWLRESDLPDDDPKIELRPGSDEVYPDNDGRVGLGHCLRLPMMPHPVTGARWPLVGPGGEKLGSTVSDILMAIESIPAELVLATAANYVPRLRPEDVPSRYLRKRAPLPDDNESASDILRELWGVANARPGKAVRCPAHDDRRPSLSILHDDKRAICKSPGCILNNNDRGCGTYQLRKHAPLASYVAPG